MAEERNDEEGSSVVFDTVERELRGFFEESDLSTPKPRPEQLVGETIADTYELLEPLGEGGMGVVFLAEHVRTGGHVAVKLIKARLDSDDALQRFELEARNTASLEHPNIVRVFDFGEDDGRMYLAMEHVPGVSLQEMLERGPLDPGLAVVIASQVLRALAAAHESERQLIHRDIKPANILVSEPDGEAFVKILDFGIARALEGPSATTQGVIGSPECMAPEQFDGGETTPATDLYAVGCTTYAMLSGRPPFSGSLSQLAHQHCNEEPQPLTELPREIPKALRDWVMWLMRKRPEERPGTAREALESLLQGTAPSYAPPPASAGMRRGPAAILAAVAVLVAGAGAWHLSRPAPPDASEARPATPDDASEAGAASAPAPVQLRQKPLPIPAMGELSPDGERVLWAKPGGIEIATVADPKPKLIASPDGSKVLHARWMPDGEHVVTTELAGQDFALWRVGLDGSREKILPRAAFAAISPDGKRLAYKLSLDQTQSHPVGIANIDGSQARTVVESSWASTLFWMSDSETLVYLVRQGDVGIQIGLFRDGVSRTLPDDPKLSTRIASLPVIAPLPERRLLVARRDERHSNLWVVDVDDDLTASPPRQITDTEGFSYMAPSPDRSGKRLLYCRAEAQGEINMLVRDESGAWEGPVLFAGTQMDELINDFSPDGQRYLFTSNRDTDFEMFEQRLGSNKQRTIPTSLDSDSGQYVGDGDQILFWHVEDKTEDWGQWRSRLMLSGPDGTKTFGEHVFEGPRARKTGAVYDFQCTRRDCLFMEWTPLELKLHEVDIEAQRLTPLTAIPLPPGGVTNSFQWAVREQEPRVALLESDRVGLYSSKTGERQGAIELGGAAKRARPWAMTWDAKGEGLLVSEPGSMGATIRRYGVGGEVDNLVTLPGRAALFLTASPTGDRIAWTQFEWQCPAWMLDLEPPYAAISAPPESP